MKNGFGNRYETLLKKVWEKRKQALQRGEVKYGNWLYPPIHNEIGSNDDGSPNKRGKIYIEPYSPNTPAEEVELAFLHLKHLQTFLLGNKRAPQKRIRKNHERDILLVKGKSKKYITSKRIKDKVEISTNNPMDNLIEKEIESIQDIKEYAQADKKARKKLIQAKYRFLHPSKK